jgi:predicted amino acid racemase
VENQKSDIGEWASNYGTTEATEEELAEIKQIKDVKCAGCGAQFHCQNSSLPGFDIKLN